MIEIVKIRTVGEESVAVVDHGDGSVAPEISYYPVGTSFNVDSESKRIDPVLPAYTDS